MDISACVEDEWIKVSSDNFQVYLMPVLDKGDYYISFVLTEVIRDGRRYDGNLFYRNDEDRFIFSLTDLFRYSDLSDDEVEELRLINEQLTPLFLWLREGRQIDYYDIWQKKKRDKLS